MPRARIITPLTPETAAAMVTSPFAALGVDPRIVRALIEEGYTVPTPIQIGVIEHGLAGRDTVACAQTGTGKTAAFVVPMLQRLEAPLAGRIRALILTPTRELAAQIDERIACYGQHMALRHTVVYGGVSQHRQEIALQRLPDILVATPGRLMDLMQQGFVKLDGVTTLVLDEADRMLDMGFIRDVKKIVQALPQKRQTLFFSATMPPAIESLANSMLIDPVRVSIAPAVTTAERVEQSVMFVDKAEKTSVLQRVLNGAGVLRAIVFTRTKHGANRLAEQLEKAGIESAPFHGNKSQNARERALESFRTGGTRVLVATDVAARGIDIEGITHVINYDLPNVAESYVHRIGRTGRAGAAGSAISFCDREERSLLRDIERFIRKPIPIAGGGQAPREAAGPAVVSAGGTEPRRAAAPRRHRGVRTRLDRRRVGGAHERRAIDVPDGRLPSHLRWGRMTCPRASGAPFARRKALALPLLLAGCGLRERVLFQPPAATRTHEAEEIREQTPAGEVRAVYLLAPPGAPTIAYFHGNGEDLTSVRGLALRFRRAGLGVFVPEYPGYGGLRGETPTVRRSLARCDAALTVLETQLACPASRTVLVGYSLGAAFAAQMAILHPAARLALCSPFTSFLDVARHHAGAAADVVVEETLDTARIAPRLSLPVLLLHGAKDSIVPPEMSATLAQLAPNAHRIVLRAAGHNDLLWADDSRAFWALVAFARGGLPAVRALGL